MAQPSRTPEPSPSLPLTENGRAILSLAIFVHLAIVLVCLASNQAPSELQQRLLGLFEPYTRLLNFDLDGTRYYLTHATERDVDHRWEALPSNASSTNDDQWQVLVRGGRGTEQRLRFLRFADAMAYFQESEDIPALLAEGVARYYSAQLQTPVQEVRCRRHTLQSREAALGETTLAFEDPEHPSYFSDLYHARIITGRQGQLSVLKVERAALEAAVKTSETSVPPTANTVPPTANTVPPTANTVPPTANTVPPTANTVPPTTNTAPPSTKPSATREDGG